LRKEIKNMVKQDRNYLTIVLLSFVTCGIYWFYYIYEIARDTNQICQGDGEETPGFASYFFLTLITCGIYAWFWYYKMGEKLDNCYVAKGFPSGNRGILYLILAFFGLGIVSYALMQDSINKAL